MWSFDFSTQLGALVPIFSLLGLGALCARMNWLPPGSGSALNRFVYLFALPLLLFVSLAQADLNSIWRPGFLLGLACGLLLTYLITFLISYLLQKSDAQTSSLRAFTATYPNSSFIGIPLLQGLFPGDSNVLIAVALATFLANLGVVITLFVLESSKLGAGQSKGALLGQLLIRVGCNPLVLSGVLGIAISATGWALPTLIVQPLEMLGNTAAPVALFAIGMALAVKTADQSPVTKTDICLLSGAKLLLQPALTWGALCLFGVSGHWLVLGVLLVSLPTGATVCVVAEAYGVYQSGTTRLFLISTWLLLLSLPLWTTVLS